MNRATVSDAGVADATSQQTTGSAERRQKRSAREFVRRGDQGATVRWLESTVATVRSDDEFGFGPRPEERPRAFHGADDVVTSLHDHPWNVADA